MLNINRSTVYLWNGKHHFYNVVGIVAYLLSFFQMVPLVIILHDKWLRRTGSPPGRLTINSPSSNHIDIQHDHVFFFFKNTYCFHLSMRLHYYWFFLFFSVFEKLFSNWCLIFISCLKVLPAKSCQLLHQQSLTPSVLTFGLPMCIMLITWRKMPCTEDGEATSRRFCSLLIFLAPLSGDCHLVFALLCKEIKEMQYIAFKHVGNQVSYILIFLLIWILV